MAIESVNPDLVAGGSGEARIAEFVAAWLREAGCSVEMLETPPGRPSVVGVVCGSGGGRSLMLNAHMDTVGAGGMERPFSPEVRDGRLYGRGAYDMKGSLAAIMLAAREVGRLGLRGDLVVTAVADEEVASQGTAAALERFTADFGICTEPTELRLCVAHKGFVWLQVETKGVAAHGSRPDLGVDAIVLMGSALTRVGELQDRLAAGRRHPLLGTGSIHASLIEGGQEMSTYPSRCVLKVERRTIPGEVNIGDEIQGATIVLERPSSEVSSDHPVARAMAEAAGHPPVIGVPYWMDMALMNAAGIPTVAFGPAGAGEHADEEWVDLASVERCVDVYSRVAQTLCS